MNKLSVTYNLIHHISLRNDVHGSREIYHSNEYYDRQCFNCCGSMALKTYGFLCLLCKMGISTAE